MAIEVRGQFEFTARVGEGEILSPFAFDLEEEFTRVGMTFVTGSLSLV